MAYVKKWGEGERVGMDDVAEPRGWRIQVDPKNTGAAHLSMGTQEIPPGGRIPVHLHEVEEEILFFHEGEGEVEIDGALLEVGPGMSVFLPSGIPHGVHNSGKVPIKMLWIFSSGSILMRLMIAWPLLVLDPSGSSQTLSEKTLPLLVKTKSAS